MNGLVEIEQSDFAPASRAEDPEISVAHGLLKSTPLIEQLLNSFPEPAVVLNANRQVVFANDKLVAFLNGEPDRFLGSRPGEVLNCIHARERAGGCGTAKFCSQCGAVKAILNCGQHRTAQVEDCRITCSSAKGTQALDLRVWATPLNLEDGAFTVFAIRDTTDEKRRAVMERLFFHDLLNTAGGLKGIMDILPDLESDEVVQMSRMARNLAAELVEEIRAQRDMAAAERGDFSPTLSSLDAAQLLMSRCVLYGHHTAAIGKRLAPPVVAGNRMIYSSEVLLSRILGNLIKNALEASSPGETVQVGFENFDVPTFTVHNPGAMPEEVQLQVFQRSFSTKAATGRGIGTYSVKLFTERYLGGTVTFTSSVEEGTTFTIRLKPSS
jgi:hypothetical protein